MKNIRLTLAYDGSGFYGFQRQPDKRTVQGEIEQAIYKITGQNVSLTPCGRTDAGVHAIMHVVNFYVDSDLPGKAFKFLLDQHMAPDILIIKSEEVDENFHARFDCKKKTYRYIIDNSFDMLPIYRKYKTHVRSELDLEKMKEAGKKLIGVHDFTAFMKWGEDVNPVRSIENIEVYSQGQDIILEFTAKSFLHNQIRISAGLLIDIGRGFRDLEYIDQIFDGKVERAAKTYGSEGLYLLDLKY